MQGVRRCWATHAALLVVQIAFAAGAVEGKLALEARSQRGRGGRPFRARDGAHGRGAAVVLQVLRAVGRAVCVPRAGPTTGASPGSSVLGIVLNQTLFLVGLRMTSAFAASLLGATIPVFAAAFAVVLGIERASLRTAVGIALAIAGVLWLTGFGGLDVGAIAIAANCLVYALYIVLSKPVIDRVGRCTVVTWLFTWGARHVRRSAAAPLLAAGSVERARVDDRRVLRGDPDGRRVPLQRLGARARRARRWSRSTSTCSR